MKIISLLFFLFFIQANIAEEIEMVTVSLVRKKVQVLVGEEFKDIKLGDQLPLSATIKSEGMGYLEFEYNGASFRVGKNTKITLSEVVNSNPETGITNSGGVRAKVDDPVAKPNVGTGKPLTDTKKKKKKKSEQSK